MLDRFAPPDCSVSNDLGEGCTGTPYNPVDNPWSFLDLILWESYCGAHATWGLRATPVEIANQTDQQSMPDGTSKHFGLPEDTGVAVHWLEVPRVESK